MPFCEIVTDVTPQSLVNNNVIYIYHIDRGMRSLCNILE